MKEHLKVAIRRRHLLGIAIAGVEQRQRAPWCPTGRPSNPTIPEISARHAIRRIRARFETSIASTLIRAHKGDIHADQEVGTSSWSRRIRCRASGKLQRRPRIAAPSSNAPVSPPARWQRSAICRSAAYARRRLVRRLRRVRRLRLARTSARIARWGVRLSPKSQTACGSVRSRNTTARSIAGRIAAKGRRSAMTC